MSSGAARASQTGRTTVNPSRDEVSTATQGARHIVRPNTHPTSRGVESSTMKRRCRLAVALVTLTIHLIAPVGVYAAPRPDVVSNDFCSAATRSAVESGDSVFGPQSAARADYGVPVQHRGHSPHSHCASCLGASLTVAIPPSATPFVVRPLALAGVHGDAACIDIAPHPALLPPLRGPPSALL